jgi:Tfp pilus assembly protein PilF
LAEADLGLGAVGPAREGFASLAANEPVRARALQGLGLANLRLGDRDAALAALEAATAADAKLWRAWVGLAKLHDTRGEWDLAAQAYERALATAPDRGLVLNNRGVSLMARGDPAQAAKQFEQALQVRPDLPAAKANLRLALAMAGHEGDILASAATEELPQVLNNLGYVAMVQGDLSRAESYFYRAIEASPTFYQRAYENLQRLDQLQEHGTSHVAL